MAADSLGSVLIDDIIIHLHFTVNDTQLLRWLINCFTIHVQLLVAEFLGWHLHLPKFPPLTLAINQGLQEDDVIVSVQFARVADVTMYGPASKLNTILLNNFLFIIWIIHLDCGVGTMLKFEDFLWSRKLAFSLKNIIDKCTKSWLDHLLALALGFSWVILYIAYCHMG